MKRGPGGRWFRLRKRLRTDLATPSTAGAKIVRHNFVRGAGKRGGRFKFTDRSVMPLDRPNTMQGTRR